MAVEIATLAADGCGYSADGRQAVYGTLPGERVQALPIARKGKRHYMRPEQLTNPAAARVQPKCGAALFCGGCSFQHLDYDAQVQLKEDHLKSLLPVQPHAWLPPLTANPYHYRSKARLGVKLVPKKGGVLVGFREKHKPYIADIDDCPVLAPPLAALLLPLRGLIGQLSAPDKVPQIEVASGDEASALVIRHLTELTQADLSALTQFALTWGVQVYLQPGNEQTTWLLSSGGSEAELTYSLPAHGLTFGFGPQDFTQVNLAINRKLADLVLALLNVQAGDQALDAFCGIGNFTLAIARQSVAGQSVAGQSIAVRGLEASQPSIARAKENAHRNGLPQADFAVADLHQSPLPPEFVKGCNKALLDPPRSGAAELVKALASTEVERVVYVSCNPETLARDIQTLLASGFELQATGLVDMFPHTTHLESVALITKGKANG